MSKRETMASPGPARPLRRRGGAVALIGAVGFTALALALAGGCGDDGGIEPVQSDRYPSGGSVDPIDREVTPGGGASGI